MKRGNKKPQMVVHWPLYMSSSVMCRHPGLTSQIRCERDCRFWVNMEDLTYRWNARHFPFALTTSDHSFQLRVATSRCWWPCCVRQLVHQHTTNPSEKSFKVLPIDDALLRPSSFLFPSPFFFFRLGVKLNTWTRKRKSTGEGTTKMPIGQSDKN